MNVGRSIGAAALLGWGVQAEAFCTEEEVLDINFGCDADEGHGGATGYLGFLRGEVYAEIQRRNYEQDDGDNGYEEERHFDSCRFAESASFIRDHHEDAVNALDPCDPDPFQAAWEFGRLLHPIQDFYAHSNLVELLSDGQLDGWEPGYDDVLDNGTGPFPTLTPFSTWRDDIVFGQVDADGDLPTAFSGAWLEDDSAIPTVVHQDGTGSEINRMLVTGWNPLDEGGRCPDVRGGLPVIDEYSYTVPFTGVTYPRTQRLVHGAASEAHVERPCGDDFPTAVCLNKDDPARPNYDQALELAGWQTQVEWCRLLHLSRDSPYGLDASSVLMTLWADIDDPWNLFDAPRQHPQATACAPADPGPVEIRVSATVLADYVDDYVSGTGVLALYTADFGQSTAREFELGPGASVVGDVSLCVDDKDTVAATVWGWYDAPVFGAPPNLGVFDQNDVVARGATATVAETSELEAVGVDLDLLFTVERDGTDKDGDGLSMCAEAYHGTDDDDDDTDDDGLVDPKEIALGTDPLDPDTDGDGLLDGEEMYIGTDQRNIDTDGDSAGDMLEVDLGSQAALADTDRDDLLDGFDPGILVQSVAKLPDTAFPDPRGAATSRAAITKELDLVEALYKGRDVAGALAHLRTALALGPICPDTRWPWCAGADNLSANLGAEQLRSEPR